MKLGVCYYPEHWPRERWSEDAKLMRHAGLSLVRIADFSWALIEPRSGHYNWKWLDEAIEVLSGEGLQVVLCTPTASPPPWLCREFPDILPVDAEGRRLRYGARRHYCPTNKTFHQHTERIVHAMATRYGKHPAIVGWQIDNELGWFYTARCYCDLCANAFRQWLRAKYSSVDALNRAWGTVFWSQLCNDWSEIELPNLIRAEANPSHVLDHYRFSSDTYVTYLNLQISTLKPLILEDQFVTTNFMSRFSDLNYYDLAEPLDMVTTSAYPTGHGELAASLYKPTSTQPTFAYDVGDPYYTSLGHSLMSGFKQHRPFWVMEQQAGNVNWSAYNTGVRPGTVRLWTWHALASGADSVLYFRWRAGLYAQEQLHSGLLRHDASQAEGYNDLKAMEQELPLMAEITSAPRKAEIALLLDYDDLWAVQLQPHNRDFGYMNHLFVYHRALQRLGFPTDIVSQNADLSPYKMVILPTAFIGKEKLASILESFAEGGGTVLIGVRSGFKTIDNLVTDQPLPGFFRKLLGITVHEWSSLPPGIGFDIDSEIPGLEGTATMWAEALRPVAVSSGSDSSSQETIARYTTGPYRSYAALSENKMGSGRALYIGWYPSDSQAEALLAHLAAEAGLNPLAELHEGLIAAQRGTFLILLNFTDETLEAKVQGRPVIVAARDVKIVRNHIS